MVSFFDIAIIIQDTSDTLTAFTLKMRHENCKPTLTRQLTYCCRRGFSVKSVRYLIEKGANPIRGFRASCQYGNLHLVKFLLPLLTFEEITAKKNYAMRMAVYGGHHSIVKELLKKDINIKAKHEFAKKYTSLHFNNGPRYETMFLYIKKIYLEKFDIDIDI